jgi:hypothetical protein
MAKLLTEGKTDLLKGFVSARTRRKFSAFLVRGKDGKVGFEFEAKTPKAALHARDRGVGAERVADHVQRVVEAHLGERRRAAQMRGLERLHVVVERAVRTHCVRLRVASAQRVGQPALLDQRPHLMHQRRRIASQIVGAVSGIH